MLLQSSFLAFLGKQPWAAFDIPLKPRSSLSTPCRLSLPSDGDSKPHVFAKKLQEGQAFLHHPRVFFTPTKPLCACFKILSYRFKKRKSFMPSCHFKKNVLKKLPPKKRKRLPTDPNCCFQKKNAKSPKQAKLLFFQSSKLNNFGKYIYIYIFI